MINEGEANLGYNTEYDLESSKTETTTIIML